MDFSTFALPEQFRRTFLSAMIRSTQPQISSERRFNRREQFRNHNFRKYQVIYDGDYENYAGSQVLQETGRTEPGRRSGTASVQRTGVRVFPPEPTETQASTTPFDLSKDAMNSNSVDANAFENVQQRSARETKESGAAQSQFRWISDRVQQTQRTSDQPSDLGSGIRFYPSYKHQQSDPGAEHKGLRQSQSSTTTRHTSRKSESAQVYRQPETAEYDRLMTPLTIATTGWTTSTSTTQTTRQTKHHAPHLEQQVRQTALHASGHPAAQSGHRLPQSGGQLIQAAPPPDSVLQNGYVPRRNNAEAVTYYGYSSQMSREPGPARVLTAPVRPSPPDSNAVGVFKASGSGHRESTSIVASTSRTVHKDYGESEVKHVVGTPDEEYNVIEVSYTRPDPPPREKPVPPPRESSRRRLHQGILQKQDSGEYDNFKKDDKVEQYSETITVFDHKTKRSESSSSQTTSSRQQKSRRPQVPRDYYVYRKVDGKIRKGGPRTRSSDRLYVAESSDDSELDHHRTLHAMSAGQLHATDAAAPRKSALRTRHEDVHSSRVEKKTRSSSSEQSEALAAYEESHRSLKEAVENAQKLLREQSVNAQRQQKSYQGKVVSYKETSFKSHTLQAPPPQPTSILRTKSLSPERHYRTLKPEEEWRDDFRLQLVGTRNLEAPGRTVKAKSVPPNTRVVPDGKAFQTSSSYSYTGRTQQKAKSVEPTVTFSSDDQVINRSHSGTSPLTVQEASQMSKSVGNFDTRQTRVNSGGTNAYTDFVQFTQRSEQPLQRSYQTEMTKKQKGVSLDRHMSENLAAFEESNRSLREAVRKAEDQLREVETMKRQHELQKESKSMPAIPQFQPQRQPQVMSSGKSESSMYSYQYQSRAPASQQGGHGLSSGHLIAASDAPLVKSVDTGLNANQSITTRSQQSQSFTDLEARRPVQQTTSGYVQQNRTVSQSHGGFGQTQQNRTATQNYQTKTQNVNMGQSNTTRKLHEMKQNGLKQQNQWTTTQSQQKQWSTQTKQHNQWTTQKQQQQQQQNTTQLKKSLLVKQASDEYDNLTTEDLVNRDNELKSQMLKKKNVNVMGEEEVNIKITGDSGQGFGQKREGISSVGSAGNVNEKWMYKQDYSASGDSVNASKNLTHDSGYFSCPALNQDQSTVYLNNGARDTRYDFPNRDNGYFSQSSSNVTYNSKEQSSSHKSKSRSSDGGGILYKTYKQNDNGYKRVRDDGIILDDMYSSSSTLTTPSRASQSQERYTSAASNRGFTSDSSARDIYDDARSSTSTLTDSKKKKHVDDKGGILFQAYRKSTQELRAERQRRSESRSKSDLYLSSGGSGSEGDYYENSKHRSYYSSRSNLGWCFQVKRIHVELCVPLPSVTSGA